MLKFNGVVFNEIKSLSDSATTILLAGYYIIGDMSAYDSEANWAPRYQ